MLVKPFIFAIEITTQQLFKKKAEELIYKCNKHFLI